MATPRGKFIWYDVMTSDTKAAAQFYSDVIGWKPQEHPMADGGIYTIFSTGPAMVAGLMAIPEPMRTQGARPCWSGYVAVDDVDADATRVKAAGGAIQREPDDIPNVGRFAIVSDPAARCSYSSSPTRKRNRSRWRR
jgi:predicted enzyme related to lactoylglutathione lyase